MPISQHKRLAQRGLDGEKKKRNIGDLWGFMDSHNIAEDLDDTLLEEIGSKVIRDFDIDEQSRSEWKEQTEEAIGLARQIPKVKQKSFPWPKAANVIYPLITVAAIQFAARVYPEVIQGNEVVKGKVVGRDPDGEKAKRAERISTHMSYQVLEEMEEWEEGMDKMLHALPVVGLVFKKTYWCPVRKRNVSDFMLPDDIVVNYNAKSLETTRRVSHVYELHENDVRERELMNIWLEVDLPEKTDEKDSGEEDPPHEFIEQHRWWDLDGDGYEEPYIVTVHKDSKKVVRILARFDFDGIEMEGDKILRIKPIHYFVKYPFIPSFDGSFYDQGFGGLMRNLNLTADSIVNVLLDAGTASTAGGGFIARGVRLTKGGKGGIIKHDPGEWIPVDTSAADLRAGLFPFPTSEPSDTLFALLGLIIEAGKEISSVKDVLTGDVGATQNVPATTVLALIEQGLKVFSGIYKRIYRSLKAEFKALYRLNSIYLEEKHYFRVLDEERDIGLDDYNTTDLDVVPVADPNMASDVQRAAKAQALMAVSGRPGMNEDEITLAYIEAIKASPERFYVEPEKRPPQPDPEMLKLQIEDKRVQIEQMRFQTTHMETLAKIKKLHADAVLAIAKAEKQEAGQQVDEYMALVKEMEVFLKHEAERMKQITGGESADKS